MPLYEGKKYTEGIVVCSGCNADIRCSRYLTLELTNADGTLKDTDYAFANFCSEHCLSEVIKAGERQLRSKSSAKVT